MSLLQRVPGMVFRLRQQRGDMRFVYASEAALPVCGLPAQELLRSVDPFFRRIHTRDRADFLASLQASAQEGGTWNWEGRIDAGTDAKWINIRATVHRPNSQTVQWDGLMLNVSRGRKREADWRDMAMQMEAAREQERARLARDVHDELGQLLTALKMDIAMLRRRVGTDDPQLLSMAELVDAATAAGRRVAAQLRPAVLDLGIADGLIWLCDQFSQRYGITITRDIDAPEHLDPMIGVQIFRIAQEALTNVARHARASTVSLRFKYRPGLLLLDVLDDGVGMPDPEQRTTASLGLRGMQERARLLHGALDCGPGDAGHGTAVRLRVPYSTARQRRD